MKTQDQKNVDIPEPTSWDWADVINYLTGELFSRQMLRKVEMPAVRIRFQVEQDQTVNAINTRWPALDEEARRAAWPDLIQASFEATKEAMPVCVGCGECCRRSSPTLYAEDLELVQEKLMPLAQLLTLRRGEAVRSPFKKEPFHLEAECIKVRESPETQACVFFDTGECTCGIYENRPMQCRAQACWDTSIAEELAEEPKLTRQELFASLEDLTRLLDEHDRRCSFTHLRKVFEDLDPEKSESIDAVIDAVAFEDHFRHFVAEQLSLPSDSLDLFFGRSFIELVKLFGFKVEKDADGSNILSPIESQP